MLYLKKHPEGIDDDELARVLELNARQQANSRCRQLEQEGLVVRKRVGGKIHNFWIESAMATSTHETDRGVRDSTKPRSWYWEGNVQSRVVAHLAREEWKIRSVADTLSRQRGIDIVAERGDAVLWITAKGYPEGADKTNPSTQAGHWFKQAVFDIVKYRGENCDALLAIALPDFPRYRSLAKMIAWLEPVADYEYYWVTEDGSVSVE